MLPRIHDDYEIYGVYDEDIFIESHHIPMEIIPGSVSYNIGIDYYKVPRKIAIMREEDIW